MEGRIVCIGGPFDGQMVDHLHPVIQFPVMRREEISEWPTNPSASSSRIMRTEYELRKIDYALGSLIISGTAYVWKHCVDDKKTIIMKIALVAGARQ